MTFIHRVVSLACMTILSLLLSSCDGGKPFKDLNAYFEKLTATKVSQNENTIALDPKPVAAKYESNSRRSPFTVRDVAPAKGTVSTNPLQAYPLDMLRFVGTVSHNGDTVAFISAPDNKIYQIKTGDIIGDHDSEVITIESDRVSLVEQTSDNGIAGVKRVVTLQLKDASQ